MPKLCSISRVLQLDDEVLEFDIVLQSSRCVEKFVVNQHIKLLHMEQEIANSKKVQQLEKQLAHMQEAH